MMQIYAHNSSILLMNTATERSVTHGKTAHFDFSYIRHAKWIAQLSYFLIFDEVQ